MVAGMPERETMSVNIAEALINAGANIDVEVRPATTFGFGVYGTPLHKAASVNHIETVKLLLKHGANVDAEDDSDNSPLHLAPCRPWGYGQATRRSGGRCSGQKPCRQSPDTDGGLMPVCRR